MRHLVFDANFAAATTKVKGINKKVNKSTNLLGLLIAENDLKPRLGEAVFNGAGKGN